MNDKRKDLSYSRAVLLGIALLLLDMLRQESEDRAAKAAAPPTDAA